MTMYPIVFHKAKPCKVKGGKMVAESFWWVLSLT